MRSSIYKSILSALALYAGTASAVSYNLRSHSLEAPYMTDGLYNRWWDFGGSTVVEVNKFVRLTTNQNSQQGWLWSRAPLTAQSWEVEFEFKVGQENDKDHLFGDGFAFFYTTDRANLGPVFGNKDYFNGLGVFFDTYPNSRHKYSFPRVMPMIGDGKTPYDSVNDGEANNNKVGCSGDFRAKKYPTKAIVRYHKGESVEVLTKFRNELEYQSCFILQNVTLPTIGYIGFTSNTGDAYDIHDIISVQTRGFVLSAKNYKKEGTRNNQRPVNHGIHEELNKEDSSYGFMFWLVVISVVLGVLYFISKRNRTNKKENLKLF